MHHMGLVRSSLKTKFENSTANKPGNTTFFELWENTLNWNYPDLFRYNSNEEYLSVKKVENIFGINIDYND